MKKKLELKKKLILPLNLGEKKSEGRAWETMGNSCTGEFTCLCSYLGKAPYEGALNIENEDDCIG